MFVFSTETLLTFKPVEALLIAINTSLGTSLHPSYVKVGDVLSADGLKATVELSARDDQPNVDDKRFTGTGTIVFNRISLGEFFGEMYSIGYDTAITSFDVARMITAETGIEFDERDFVESVITSDSNRLVASPNSLRWVGELSIGTP
jgi:hypothetical protein